MPHAGMDKTGRDKKYERSETEICDCSKEKDEGDEVEEEKEE